MHFLKLRSLLEDTWQDARYGFRMFARQPAATAVSVLALAIGIGVNTAAFTGYKAMVLRPVDAEDASAMRNVAIIRDSGAAEYFFSYADFETFRSSVRGFSGMIAWHPERVTLSMAGSDAGTALQNAARMPSFFTPGSESAEFAQIFIVSPNYFEVTGRKPLLEGTAFAQNNSVVIGEAFWQNRFGRDPSILGRSILLNNIPAVITGIARRGFVGTGISEPAFWVSSMLDPLMEGRPDLLVNRESSRYRVFGRLASHVTAAGVQTEMNAAIEQLRGLHKPGTGGSTPGTALLWTASPFPLPMHRYPGLGAAVLLILCGTAMVLAVACANVGSLQLARVRARHSELKMRTWLGATRPRMMRQFATEYAILGLVSGALAHAVAFASLKVLVWWSGRLLPVGYGALIFDVTPDATLLLYVAGLSVFGGLLAGLAPSLLAGKSDGRTHDGRRAQNILVAVQVALSLVLLATAGMLVHSSLRALQVDPGYEAAHLLTVAVEFQKSANVTQERQQALLRRLQTEVAVLPGVRKVVASPPPGAFRSASVRVPNATAKLPIRYGSVVDGYLDALGIPLLAGRGPESATPQGIAINETAARRLWPDEPLHKILGRSVLLEGTNMQDRSVFVLGVVRNTANLHLGTPDHLEAYVAAPPGSALTPVLLVRTEPMASQLVQPLMALMRSSQMQAEGFLTRAAPLEQSIRQSSVVVVSGIAAAVASSVGALGLLLALMGIAGTVSYIVALRTREVGIRMAIGAQKADVLSLIMREGARPVLAGLLVGVVASSGALYGISRFIFGAGGIDLVALTLVAGLFLAMALGSSLGPLRRALAVDPAVALRQET